MNRRPTAARITGLAAAAAALLGTTGATGATGTAHATTQETAPPCLTYTSDWRYTSVTNGCSEPHTVQVAYAHGELSPCRRTEPGDRITFAGYGTDADYVTRIRLC